MPELPEIETIGSYLKKHILHSPIIKATVRQQALRWPIPDLSNKLPGISFDSIGRRSKYLLLNSNQGSAILHLGMSGQLIITNQTDKVYPHEHVTISFANNKLLRFVDPRRFGAFLWTEEDPLQHRLLAAIGPEPLTETFTADYLAANIQKRRIPIKQLIMDGHIVAGVGNIYASEALFLATIDPRKASNKLTYNDCAALVISIKQVLKEAIAQGGSSIRNYVKGDGEKGGFQNSHKVYGRTGKPCPICQTKIQEIRLAQRNTFFCPNCQK